ncbi:MAG: hypothetical protein HYU66_22590 [Armatimonadetes bacterium]|nr:hypothetical protein [Armatimonadota bacterium]
MSDDPSDQERRRKQVEDAVERARTGAKRVGGWLRDQLGSAVESARNSAAVRRKMDELQARREGHQHDRELGAVEAVYDTWTAALLGAMDGFESQIEAVQHGVDTINQSVGSLQIRGVGEDDPEMQEYRGHLQRMRAQVKTLHEQTVPFREETERMQRSRNAALARAEAGVDPLESILADARRHVDESRQRLGGLIVHLDQEPAQDEGEPG